MKLLIAISTVLVLSIACAADITPEELTAGAVSVGPQPTTSPGPTSVVPPPTARPGDLVPVATPTDPAEADEAELRRGIQAVVTETDPAVRALLIQEIVRISGRINARINEERQERGDAYVSEQVTLLLQAGQTVLELVTTELDTLQLDVGELGTLLTRLGPLVDRVETQTPRIENFAGVSRDASVNLQRSVPAIQTAVRPEPQTVPFTETEAWIVVCPILAAEGGIDSVAGIGPPGSISHSRFLVAAFEFDNTRLTCQDVISGTILP